MLDDIILWNKLVTTAFAALTDNSREKLENKFPSIELGVGVGSPLSASFDYA